MKCGLISPSCLLPRSLLSLQPCLLGLDLYGPPSFGTCMKRGATQAQSVKLRPCLRFCVPTKGVSASHEHPSCAVCINVALSLHEVFALSRIAGLDPRWAIFAYNLVCGREKSRLDQCLKLGTFLFLFSISLSNGHFTHTRNHDNQTY